MRSGPGLRQEAHRTLKFSFVGVSNTVIVLVAYAVLLRVGLPYRAAGALGWTLGILNGYTWNRIWTFDGASHQTSLLVRYSIVGAIGLGLNTGLLSLLVSSFGINELPAEFIALPFVVLTTFLLNRFWVFREHVEEGASDRARARG